MVKVRNFSIENCRIIFRNFSGKQSDFNPAGRRNFSVVLDKETADSLKEDGWNVKTRSPKNPDDETLYSLPVAVSYDNFPPKIFIISGNIKTELDESSVSAIDYAEIENVDLVIRPYHWETNGKTGIKAYVKSMYVTVVKDEFQDKYSEFEEGNRSADYPSEDDDPDHLPF